MSGRSSPPARSPLRRRRMPVPRAFRPRAPGLPVRASPCCLAPAGRSGSLLSHLLHVGDGLLRTHAVRVGSRLDLAPRNVALVAMLFLSDAAPAVCAHRDLLSVKDPPLIPESDGCTRGSDRTTHTTLS